MSGVCVRRRLASLIVVLVVLVALVVSAPVAQAQSRLSGWAATVVAADWRTSEGRPIQAFDNARRALVTGLLAAGFERGHLYDATLRPDVATPVSAASAIEGMKAVTAGAPRGCLLYFTSHGSPDGMVFGPQRILNTTAMAMLVRDLCPARPAVIVVSACYSGVFVDSLAGPDRMVITAARRDRSSFGCSEDATYPYFDGCMIESLPTASDFIALANAARACIKRREAAEGLTPGSDPQVSIGANMQLLLPTVRFNQPSSPVSESSHEASSGS